MGDAHKVTRDLCNTIRWATIQIRKLLTIRPHSSQQFSETWVHIVGDGGVLEKKLWAKRFGTGSR
jgi:hypothetical protein